ncbi:hydrogen gas-evolving membrane-bound hydrogenase subunit E [Roseibacillus persicicus]|uniref:hydrogen gas-evolving membrane-bound hydrogenase subunit E n=1 Tax=Roseibacillus persicicus TaxID=454148 RepID=UPI00280CD50A|nr:hydrogen gas-evolving membrane-bound hydrogenase subunit E [Roseibacillus persicicus]MDQ8189828.1 proton-conducting transporter membrane subunit [Roseibacillus persicicus]
MPSPFLLLALPALLALVVPFFPRKAFGPFAAIALLAAGGLLLPIVAAGEDLFFDTAWIPQLGMDFALRITPFSAWFGFLIFTIGGGIILYASTYFAQNPRLKTILSCLLLFTSAMLGVIWSDNFLLLFLFWEATSLLSFLLVGFHHEKEDTRAKAAQALLVTFFGGAALLVGFVLLTLETGATALSGLQAVELSNSPLATAAVVLIILGAATKSAQFPFHFWLPNAMAGPTPVSAFLHSATMVKAGVFLLASLAPVLSAHPVWTPTLATLGLLTVAVSVMRGLREQDMKGLLACTTLAALGFLTLLAGIGTPAALKAFVIFLTAHALYKAPLFLSAGNLEKAFGSRQLPDLRGAIAHLPWTGAIIVVSLASLLGLPPFPGFLGKEYLLAAVWESSPWLAVATALAAAGALCVGLRLLLPLLLKRPEQAPPLKKVPAALSLATTLPALAVVLSLIAYPWVNKSLWAEVATSLSGKTVSGFYFWAGWNPALGLGLGALALSIAATALLVRRRSKTLEKSFFEEVYDTLVRALLLIAKGVSRLLEKGTLNTHLAIMLAAIGMVAAISLRVTEWPNLTANLSDQYNIFLALAPALAISTIVAARAQTPLTILVSLGIVGLLISFIYLWFSAPDLALTQLLAETLILFLMAGVLFKARHKAKKVTGKIWRATFAASAGLLVTILILKSMALEWDHPVSDFYLAESKPSAFGANVVNVILVDFRALDTLGEIVVLAIAALGANAALGAARSRAPLPGLTASSWMSAGLPLVIALLVPTALWFFWRGHNAPGGGFIAALLVAASIGIGLLGNSPALTPRRMRNLSRALLIGGLAIALLSALLPLSQGLPFFTGLWFHSGDFHLGTPVLFDLGVFLTVIGFTMNYLRHFHISRS